MSQTDSRQSAVSLLQSRFPILCLVTDLDVAGGSVEKVAEIVRQSVAGGVNMVQVRAPNAEPQARNRLLNSVVRAVNDEALVILNTHSSTLPMPSADLDGYHLPERESASISRFRSLLPRDLIIGTSAHSVYAAEDSATAGADYVTLGTIFPSGSHPGGESMGVALVHEVRQSVRLPLIAIGGIEASNAADVIRAGASGIAVIRSIAEAQSPRHAAAELSRQIQQAWDASRAS